MMRLLAAAALVVGSVFVAASAFAGGCYDDFYDMGDAPECVPAYPSGVIGHFPTCWAECGAGTQEVSSLCPPRSTPPGPEGGAVYHVNNYDAWQMWLGCYGSGFNLYGADSDQDCAQPSQCTETAFGMSFPQDECVGDNNDAALRFPPSFRACRPATITYKVTYCTGSEIYLNVLIDLNGDGDWNDSFTCDTTCAFEWAIKNWIVSGFNCANQISPVFMIGPHSGPAWMRVTLSSSPASDGYPWNGLSYVYEPNRPTEFFGGETEDYPVVIDDPTPATPMSWGRLKAIYR